MRRWHQFLVLLGAGDLLTGLVLIGRPGWVLSPLGVESPRPDIFLRWIGVFVAMVGAATIVPWFERDPAARAARMRDASAWSAQTRCAVSAFVALAVLSGALATGFAVVGAWDALAAVAQKSGAKRFAAGRDVDV